MAHIPYGYRIERGRAVIVPEEAEKIRAFLNAYLDGLSIRNAGAKAQIPLSTSALRKMLGNGLYLGTDYYPAVIDRDTFDAVQRDCAARTHEGQSKPPPITPVRGRFMMAAPEHPAVGRDGHLVVVEYYDKILAELTCMRKTFKSHSAGKSSVANDSNYFTLVAIEFTGSKKSKGR